MTLITRSSFNGTGELKSGEKIMILKKYVWIDEAGKVAETTENQLSEDTKDEHTKEKTSKED